MRKKGYKRTNDRARLQNTAARTGTNPLQSFPSASQTRLRFLPTPNATIAADDGLLLFFFPFRSWGIFSFRLVGASHVSFLFLRAVSPPRVFFACKKKKRRTVGARTRALPRWKVPKWLLSLRAARKSCVCWYLFWWQITVLGSYCCLLFPLLGPPFFLVFLLDEYDTVGEERKGKEERLCHPPSGASQDITLEQ